MDDRMRPGRPVERPRGGAGVSETRRRYRALALVGGALALLLAVAVVLVGRRGPLSPVRPAPSAAPRVSVAVLAFRPEGDVGDAAWLSTALTEMLTLELGAAGRLRVVDAAAVARYEADRRAAGVVAADPEEIPRGARALGADLLAHGSFASLPDGKLRVRVAVGDAVGRGRGEAQEQGSEEDLIEVVSRLARTVRQAAGVPGEASASRSPLPRDPLAARLYAEGLRHLRQFDALAARERLEKAAAAAPESPVVQAALATCLVDLGLDGPARTAARRALDLSSDLPLHERLEVEALYRELSGEWERAVELRRLVWLSGPEDADHAALLVAAEVAAGRGREALGSMEEMRRAFPGGDARLDLAEAQAAASVGESVRAEAAAARAVVAGRRAGARLLAAQALLVQADSLRRLGRGDEALAAVHEAHAAYLAAGDRGGAARALALRANVLWYKADFAGARAAAAQAAEMSRAVGDKKGLTRSLNTLAGLLSDDGKLQEARRLYTEALAASADSGDRDREAVAANNMGIVFSKLGDLARAREALTAAEAIARELGGARRLAYARYHLGEVLCEMARLDEARAAFEESQRLAGEAGIDSRWPDALAGQARVLYERDDRSPARDLLDRVVAIDRRREDPRDLAPALLASARLGVEEGRLEQSEQELAEALRILASEPARHRVVPLHAGLAEARLRRGDLAGAEVAAQAALALVRQVPEYALLRLAVELQVARVQATRGHLPEARARAEAARDEAARASLGLLRLEADVTLGRLELAAGRADARARLERVAAEAEAAGFRRLARRAREALSPAS